MSNPTKFTFKCLMHNCALLYYDADYDEFIKPVEGNWDNVERLEEDEDFIRAGYFVFQLDHLTCEEDRKLSTDQENAGERCRAYWQAVFHFDV